MIILQEIETIRYGICERSDVDEMITLLADVFPRMDPPAVAVDLTAPEFATFVRLFASKATDENVTIIARSINTGEIAGALLTEDSGTPMPNGMEQLSRKFDPIFGILGELEMEYRGAKSIPIGDSLHLFLLGVARNYGGHGVAQNLVTTCLHNGARRAYRLAVTEATNSVSQHIFRKLGFINRVQRSYRGYRFEGETPFAGIQGHLGPMLMDRTI